MFTYYYLVTPAAVFGVRAGHSRRASPGRGAAGERDLQMQGSILTLSGLVAVTEQRGYSAGLLILQIACSSHHT